MKIITSGSAYLDIDAYAGIIAYAEMLQKQAEPAQAVSTAAPNETVTRSVRSWPVSLQSEYTPQPEDTFTLIDISIPEYFDTFVDHGRIDAVIDHHPGHEKYWQEKIGDGTNIEPIGSACTQVYEYWKRAGLVNKMSETSARLLICGILDNTLNFGAKISTQRDEDAYHDLMRFANLPSNWPEHYFGECQESIENDPIKTIENDAKSMQFPSREGKVRVGQFAAWDAAKILTKFQPALVQHFESQHKPWFINIISIGERMSYFLTSDPEVQNWLSELLGLTFEEHVAAADRLWLRKEIMQASIDNTSRQTSNVQQ